MSRICRSTAGINWQDGRESPAKEYSNLGTLFFTVGFTLMLALG